MRSLGSTSAAAVLTRCGADTSSRHQTRGTAPGDIAAPLAIAAGVVVPSLPTRRTGVDGGATAQPRRPLTPELLSTGPTNSTYLPSVVYSTERGWKAIQIRGTKCAVPLIPDYPVFYFDLICLAFSLFECWIKSLALVEL